MDIQYILFIVIIIFIGFFMALGINKTTKIFIGNYIAGFSSIASYLFLDFLINYIDTNSVYLNIQNPDVILGFLLTNKIRIIIGIYFLFLIVFYKSRLFEININGVFNKFFLYIFVPIATVINIMFTVILIVNGAEILTYSSYSEFVNSLNISNYFFNLFFNFIPAIIIFIPIFVGLFFLKINIKIPKLKLGKKKIEK